MAVITISRQYGSLGDEIGRDVAERLGYRLVDQDILDEVASRLGVTKEALTQRDEREPGLVAELVRAMRRLYPATVVRGAPQPGTELDEYEYARMIGEVVSEVARTNDAVILGRGANFILREHPGIVHVLLVAPMELRVERVMAAEGLSRQAAEHRVHQVDEERTRYSRHFYRGDWLDVRGYDLVLNTGHFPPPAAVSLVCAAVAAEGDSR